MGTILSYLSSLSPKIKSMVCLGVLALLLGCTTLITNEAAGIKPIQTFAVTPEGWWIIYTNEQDFVARMCHAPGNKDVIGCARWPTNPEILPAVHCIVSIYTNSEESIESIREHELRHCREGSFHPED